MKASLLLISLLLSAPAIAGKTTLLSVVDRTDPDVGKGCEDSYLRLKKFLLDAAKGHEDLFQLYDWKKEISPTPGDVLNFFRSVKVGTDDVLWFFYCGHGATDDQRGGHYFKMSSGDLSRKELREVMQSRGARGVVLTTDACGVPGQFENTGPTAQGAPPILEEHWTALKSLLDSTKGTVDFTATTGKTKAFVDPEMGANFSNALFYVLSNKLEENDIDRDGKISWPEVFALTRDQTRTNFFSMWHKVAMSRGTSYLTAEDRDQIPYAFSLGADQAPALIESGVSVDYLIQRPFQTVGEEQGTRFIFKSRLAPKFEGRTIQFYIAFYNARSELIPIKPGSRYTNYFDLKVEKWHLQSNDNTPWEIFVSDLSIDLPADGQLWAKLIVFDVTDRERFTTPYEKFFKLTDNRNLFGPRPQNE